MLAARKVSAKPQRGTAGATLGAALTKGLAALHNSTKGTRKASAMKGKTGAAAPVGQGVPSWPQTMRMPTGVPAFPPAQSPRTPAVADRGLFIAPNFVYRCGAGGAQECVTDVYTPQVRGFEAACDVHCVDGITRGLLSGLQPMMAREEPLFGPAW